MITREFVQSIRKINPVSKTIIAFGAALSMGLLIFAAGLSLSASALGNYWHYQKFAIEIVNTVGRIFVAALIPALIADLVVQGRTFKM